MKVLLSCCIGMSTSLLTELMNQVSERQSRGHEVSFINIDNLDKECIENCDVLLLGPQIRHTLKSIRNEFGNNIPIGIISASDYGFLEAENVLNYAESLYKESLEKKEEEN